MNQLNKKILEAKKKQRNSFFKVICLTMIILFLISTTYFLKESKKIVINPKVDSYHLNISNGNALVLFKRILIFSKDITINLSSKGFKSYQNNFAKNNIKNININLIRESSSIKVITNSVIGENNWFLDNKLVSTEKNLYLEIEPGIYKLRLENRFYLNESLELNLTDIDHKKDFKINQSKANGRLEITTDPEGANIFIDGEEALSSPINIKIKAGIYNLKIEKKGYQTISRKIEIDNSKLLQKDKILLKPSKLNVTLNLNPKEGDLIINGILISKNLRLKLDSKKKYKISYKKAGFTSQSKEYYFSENKKNIIKFNLNKEFGEIQINSDPKGMIIIDNESYGISPVKIRLQTLKKKLEIKKEGYEPFKMEILTKPNELSIVNAVLEKEIEKLSRISKNNYTNSIGVTMKLFTPGRFTMGAPRHEKGQRANEFIKDVILRKKFYISLTEITSEQFKKYKNIRSDNKNNNIPISNITWIEAIGFCNWLSEKEGLDKVYLFNGKNYLGANLQNNGYRLPTEAEWEWLARKAERNKSTKFSWGKSLPIPKLSGNLADESVIGFQKLYIPNYNDNYKFLAPVASFNKDISGVFDLTGNVKEWVHDYYLVTVPKDNMIYYDPSGPEKGVGHVVKGSSYLSATLQEVRASYRDSEEFKKGDIGFRIARYFFGKEFKNNAR